MNLPEDRSERIKLLAIVVLLTIAAIYLLAMFGIGPLLQKQQARRDRQEMVEDLLWRAERDIDLLPHNRTANHTVLKEIFELTEVNRYVLRSNLGNFLLVARDIVITRARQLGLQIDNVSELTPPSLDKLRRREGPPPEPEHWFKPYTVAVTLECGLPDLTRLLSALESENPLLCITALDITARPGHPERHAISFNVTWPIWTDEDWPPILVRQLVEEEDI